MLKAKTINGIFCWARDVEKGNDFFCPECGEKLILKKGVYKVHHFSHFPTSFCEYGRGETIYHLMTKQKIYDILKKDPLVTYVDVEVRLEYCRADILFIKNNKKIAIEVQLSNISIEEISSRTYNYMRMGIAVLWLRSIYPLYCNSNEYLPPPLEKYIHCLYFGRVYYWLNDGDLIKAGHFEQRSEVKENDWLGWNTRVYFKRKVVRFGSELSLLKDFNIKFRQGWEGGSLSIPKGVLYMDEKLAWWEKKNNSAKSYFDQSSYFGDLNAK